MPLRSFDDYLAEQLRDPAFAEAYREAEAMGPYVHLLTREVTLADDLPWYCSKCGCEFTDEQTEEERLDCHELATRWRWIEGVEKTP